MGGLFGGGDTTTVVHTEQAAAQAANVTVNPSTTVSLTFDLDKLAKAIREYTGEMSSVTSRNMETTEKYQKLDLLLRTANIGLLKDQIALESQNVAADVALSERFALLGDDALKLLKGAVLIGAVLYFVKKR